MYEYHEAGCAARRHVSYTGKDDLCGVYLNIYMASTPIVYIFIWLTRFPYMYAILKSVVFP